MLTIAVSISFRFKPDKASAPLKASGAEAGQGLRLSPCCGTLTPASKPALRLRA
jgi:hypothetical protein